MTYANATERQALICGLRAMADFLETNPDVPAPTFTDVLVFPPSACDAENSVKSTQSPHASATVTYSSYRHHQTSRRFGPVQYRAVAIPADENKKQ